MRHHLKGKANDLTRRLSGTDEFIGRNGTDNEVRGRSLLRVYRDHALTGDFLRELRQIGLNGLHIRGKEFSLLSSKNSGCETIGWIPVL